MCFDRNINGNRDVTFFEWDYWSLKNLKMGPVQPTRFQIPYESTHGLV